VKAIHYCFVACLALVLAPRNEVPFCRVCDAALEQVIDSIAPGAPRP